MTIVLLITKIHLKLESIELFLGFSKNSKKKSNKLNNFLVRDDGQVEILKN